MTPSEFFTKMSRYAQKAAEAISVSPAVILAQWGIESGYGTSRFATEGLNFGGIKLSAYSPTKEYMIQGNTNAKFAKYSSIDQFVQDYTRVLKLGYYANVRSAEGTASEVAALAASPYDAGHYGGTGASLLSVIKTYGLEKYNTMVVADPSNTTSTTSGSGGITGNTETLNLVLPKGLNNELIAWLLIGAGVLFMIKALGGSPREVVRYGN